jgi:hypothetical protein
MFSFSEEKSDEVTVLLFCVEIRGHTAEMHSNGFFFMTSQLFLFLKCAIASHVKNNQNFIVFLYEKTKFFASEDKKERQ